MRTCLGCRKIRNKRELVRIVRTPEGEIRVDPGGKMNGRGAYLCRDRVCFAKAIKRGALARALGAEIPEEAVSELARIISREED